MNFIEYLKYSENIYKEIKIYTIYIMTGYIIEEVDECPIYVCVSNGKEIEEYWRLYSKVQKKRFKGVLNQMMTTWFNVYKTIKMLRDMNALDMNNSNDLMNKVHKMFIIEHKANVEYYNDEKLRLRKQKGYMSKKINKLKNSKPKL